MPFGDTLISFVMPKVYDEFALFFKDVTREEKKRQKKTTMMIR